LIWLRIGTGGRLGNASSGVIKCGELLDKLRICQLLKRDFAV